MNNIKEIRKKKNIPVKYISFVTKVSVSYISLLERNKRKNPTLEIMKSISNVLEEPVNRVFF